MTGEAILAHANALGCDLLIKGAYTQSRLQQIIFGGTTRYILSNAELPREFITLGGAALGWPLGAFQWHDWDLRSVVTAFAPVTTEAPCYRARQHRQDPTKRGHRAPLSGAAANRALAPLAGRNRISCRPRTHANLKSA